MTPSLVFKQEA